MKSNIEFNTKQTAGVCVVKKKSFINTFEIDTTSSPREPMHNGKKYAANTTLGVQTTNNILLGYISEETIMENTFFLKLILKVSKSDHEVSLTEKSDFYEVDNNDRVFELSAEDAAFVLESYNKLTEAND